MHTPQELVYELILLQIHVMRGIAGALKPVMYDTHILPNQKRFERVNKRVPAWGEYVASSKPASLIGKPDSDPTTEATNTDDGF